MDRVAAMPGDHRQPPQRLEPAIGERGIAAIAEQLRHRGRDPARTAVARQPLALRERDDRPFERRQPRRSLVRDPSSVGSASVRERVGQYGATWVVAVSLNKNYMHI